MTFRYGASVTRGGSEHRPQSYRAALCLLFFSLWLLSGCEEAPAAVPVATATPPATILNVGISSSATSLQELVAEAYAQENERAILNFVVANNLTLFQDLEAGQLDAILVHHLPQGNQYWFNPVALDGLVVVVHPENRLRTLELSQIQSLFSGQVSNWADVGGANIAVHPIAREQGAGSRILFDGRVMAAQRVSINTLIEPDDEALLQAVSEDPGAVGYSMMSALGGGAVPLSVEKIEPTPQTTATQEYPLTVPLYFVSPEEPRGELRAFLAWLQSEAGQTLLGEKFGRVS